MLDVRKLATQLNSVQFELLIKYFIKHNMDVHGLEYVHRYSSDTGISHISYSYEPKEDKGSWTVQTTHKYNTNNVDSEQLFPCFQEARRRFGFTDATALLQIELQEPVEETIEAEQVIEPLIPTDNIPF